MTKKEIFKAINFAEETFMKKLEKDFGLINIKGPLFVEPSTGFNDDLSGTERAVSFKNKDKEYEIVQSLAKWKRWALKEYDFEKEEGLFVKMHAIRPDENETSKYHDLHVDQYDWERHIGSEMRNIDYLKEQVSKIYGIIFETKEELKKKYKELSSLKTDNVTFITSEELRKLYPKLTSEEREKEFAKEHKAIFIMKIGHKLEDGVPHGLRAPDYDDWDLNGDLIVWDEINKDAIELSSMGIRVDSKSIISQHEIADRKDKLSSPFHKSIIESELPLSIGGGIGRSRINMFLLEQKHILDVK